MTNHAMPARVALHSHAYSALMEGARAAMPAETLGLLLGSSRANASGLNWAKAKNLRITVKEVSLIRPASGGATADRYGNIAKVLVERAGMSVAGGGHGLKVVGWFYADPGTGIFPARISVEEIQSKLPESASLFLLVNPSTDQGAFYWWNGRQFVPDVGFDEVLPEESGRTVVEWSGEVRGATRWFGALLAESPRVGISTDDADATSGEDDAPPSAPSEMTRLQGEAQGEAQGDHPQPLSPVYVEVITEEPVEYVAPEMPITTGEMTPPQGVEGEGPPAGAETQPYPILAEEATLLPDKEKAKHVAKITGPLKPEDADVPDGGTALQPGGSGKATAKLDTGGDDDPGSDHAFSTVEGLRASYTGARTALVPVSHSAIRLVMKQRDWREPLHVLGGLAVMVVVGIVLLVGLLGRQDDTTSNSPGRTAPLPEKSSLAQTNGVPSPDTTLLPAVSGPAGTAIVTSTATTNLPGINK